MIDAQNGLSRAELEVIRATLVALAKEPREWTPRELVAAAAKAGGWSQTLVSACLYGYGTDGYR